MVKLFSPIPDDELPPTLRKIARLFVVNGQAIASRSTKRPQVESALYTAQLENYSAAHAAWRKLKTWKKARWTLCAIAQKGNLATLSSVRGGSAYALYLKCWLEQNTPPDKQPISPCSARVTDASANPWDFQP